jgi:hypothetical protein
MPQHAYTARLLSSVPKADHAWLEQDGAGDGALEFSAEA